MKRIVLFAAVVALLCGAGAALLACHGPIAIHDTSDPTMYVDAGDPCAAACGFIMQDRCTTAGVADNPRCAWNCRNDQYQGAGASFPLACILDAGTNRDAIAACGVTCP